MVGNRVAFLWDKWVPYEQVWIEYKAEILSLDNQPPCEWRTRHGSYPSSSEGMIEMTAAKNAEGNSQIQDDAEREEDCVDFRKDSHLRLQKSHLNMLTPFSLKRHNVSDALCL